MKWRQEDIQSKLNEIYSKHGSNGEAYIKFSARELYDQFADNDQTFEEWVTELKTPFDSMKRILVQSMDSQFQMRSTVNTRKKPVGYSTDREGEVWYEVELRTK